MKPSVLFSIFFTSLLFGLVGGMTGSIVIYWMHGHDDRALIGDFYGLQDAVFLSPARLSSERVNSVLVDMRSPEDFKAGHIEGAVNIFVNGNARGFSQDEIDWMIEEFKKASQGKKVILMCDASFCDNGVGKMLADYGIYARQLSVGYDEWKE